MGKLRRDGVEPTRPDLLARIDALSVSNQEFTRMAGCPRTFVSMMRIGKCKMAAPETWTRMEKTLGILEGAQAVGQAPMQASVQGTKGPSPEDKAIDDLSDAIVNADTLEKWIKVQRWAVELTARGVLSPARARVVNEGMARGQQLFRAQAEDAERAKAGEEMIVVVKYIDTWRKKQ